MDPKLFAAFWLLVAARGVAVSSYGKPFLALIETIGLWAALIVFTPPLTV